MSANKLSPIWQNISSHLEAHCFCITAAGVRYGSVIYFGFGESITRENQRRFPTTQFSVELEIGADNWSIRKNETTVLHSQFSDVEQTRSQLRTLFIDRKVLEMTIEGDLMILHCSGDVVVEMAILPDPSSGFLIAFQVIDGATWESIDGKQMLFD